MAGKGSRRARTRWNSNNQQNPLQQPIPGQPTIGSSNTHVNRPPNRRRRTREVDGQNLMQMVQEQREAMTNNYQYPLVASFNNEQSNHFVPQIVNPVPVVNYIN